jgi:hypothetical protein
VLHGFEESQVLNTEGEIQGREGRTTNCGKRMVRKGGWKGRRERDKSQGGVGHEMV